MISFKRFLTQAHIFESDEDFEQEYNAIPFSKIKSDCSEWLSNTNGPAFRGIGRISNSFYVKRNVRQDRKPKDSSKAFTSILNVGIELATGKERIRNSSLFITDTMSTAANYGGYSHVYFVFVPNGYTLVYSPTVDDAYSLMGVGVNSVEEWLDEAVNVDNLYDGNFTELVKWFQETPENKEMEIGTVKEFREWAYHWDFPYTDKFLKMLQKLFDGHLRYTSSKSFDFDSPGPAEIMATDIDYAYLISCEKLFTYYKEAEILELDEYLGDSDDLIAMHKRLVKDIKNS